MKRLFGGVCILILLCSICSLSLAEEKAVLKDGTPVMLRLTEEVSTKTKNLSDSIRFEVTKDVIVNGKMLVKAGTPADGTVSVCQKPDILGQEGTIAFTVNSTKAVDGQWVYLRSNLSRSGENKMLISAGAAYACCPIFGLIKGSGASFPVGSEIKSYTENDVAVMVQ